MKRFFFSISCGIFFSTKFCSFIILIVTGWKQSFKLTSTGYSKALMRYYIVVLLFSFGVYVHVSCRQQQELLFYRFDPFGNRTLSSTIPFTTATDIRSAANITCTSLFFDQDWLEINRCTSLAIHSMRDAKLVITNDLFNGTGMAFSNDLDLLINQYIYDTADNTEIPKDEKKREHNSRIGMRVCTLGLPNLSVLTSMLLSPGVQDVLVFVAAIHDHDERNMRLLQEIRQHTDVLSRQLKKNVYYYTYQAGGEVPTGVKIRETGFQDTLQRVFDQLELSGSTLNLCDAIHYIQSIDIGMVEVITQQILDVMGTHRTSGNGGGNRLDAADGMKVIWSRRLNMEADTQWFPNVTVDGHTLIPCNVSTYRTENSVRALNSRPSKLHVSPPLLPHEHGQSRSSSSRTPANLPNRYRIEWQFSSSWTVESTVQPMRNLDGFTGRAYSSPRHWTLLYDISIGTIRKTNNNGLFPRTASLNDPQHARQQGHVSTMIPGIAMPNKVGSEDLALNTAHQQVASDDSLDREHASTCSIGTTVIAITYTIRVFAETAHGLRMALRRLGYRHVYILPDFTLDVYEHLLEKAKGLAEEAYGEHNRRSTKNSDSFSAWRKQKGKHGCVLQISLAPHDMAILSPNYVVFQMEQVWSPIAFTGPLRLRYAMVLSNALCILSYSPFTASILRSLGYPCVFVIPMYSLDPEVQRHTEFNNGHLSLLSDGNTTIAHGDTSHDAKTFDVMFYGSCNKRRTEIVVELANQIDNECQKKGVEVGRGKGGSSECHNYHLLCTNWESGSFDAKRFVDVTRSRLILNIHHDPRNQSVLEVHRINYLLGLGKCVVSERSHDQLLDTMYEGVLHFIEDTASATVYNTLKALWSNATALQLCESQSRAKYKEISANTSQLETALNHVIYHHSTAKMYMV